VSFCTFRHDTTDDYFSNYDRPLEVFPFFALFSQRACHETIRPHVFFFLPAILFLFLFDATLYEKKCNDTLDIGHLPSCTAFSFFLSFCSILYLLLFAQPILSFIICTFSFALHNHSPSYPPSSIFSSAPCVAQVPPRPPFHPTPSLRCDSRSHLRYDIDTLNRPYPDLDESWAILCLLFNTYYFISWTPSL